MPDSWTVGAPPLLYTQERGRREPKPRASPGFDSPPDTLGPLQGLFAGRIRESIPACQWFDTPGSKRTEIHARELVVKCRRKRNSAEGLAALVPVVGRPGMMGALVLRVGSVIQMGSCAAAGNHQP